MDYVVPARTFLADDLPKYEDLIDVPDDLRTRRNWFRNDRKPRAKAQPVGLLKDRDGEFYYDRLYRFEDTRPLTRREKALNSLWDVYCRHHHGPYIFWCDARDEWLTVGKNYFPRGYQAADHLRRRDLDDHVSHRRLFGVIGHGRITRFGAIDLDMHDRANNPLTPGRVRLFEQQLRVLLDHFHGDGWHLQAADQHAEGVHLLQVLAYPVSTAEYTTSLKAQLRELDRAHPGLDLAALEVYPDPAHGFRLPLGRGRILLLDEPLHPIANRLGRLVGDVLRYTAWLDNPDREYMSREDALHAAVERLKRPQILPPPGSQNDSTRQSATTSPPSPHDHVPYKGSARQKIIDFWTGVDRRKGRMGEMLLVTARFLKTEVDQYRAAELLEEYCDDLPDPSVSSRLVGDRGELTRDIRKIVARVYRDNGGQGDSAASDDILLRVRQAWDGRGFFVSDKRTWADNAATPVSIAWTGDEVKLIEKALLPVLNIVVRDSASKKTRPPRDRTAELNVACDVVREVVETVHRYRHGEVAATLLDTILVNHGVKLAVQRGSR